MTKYVLVHGAWHSGAELEPVADLMRAEGHEVHTPTTRGNGPHDEKTTGLAEAIDSIVEYLDDRDLTDIVLVGHSFGGMVITGAADRVPQRIRRLVYCSAFVPNNGEAVTDMAPPSFATMLDEAAAERSDGSFAMPFPVWRELLINDADLETAKRTHDLLNPHPIKTFTDKIVLSKNPADLPMGKSFINCTEDSAMPYDLPWHPRLSQKLGFFRLVQIKGSHEVCFSNPARLAGAILDAGRD